MRLDRRSLLVGFVVSVLVTGVGLSLASAGSTATVEMNTPPEEIAPVPPEDLASLDESEEVDFASEGASAWLVEACQKDPSFMGETIHCNAVIAISEGQLAPGEYSNSELGQELSE